MSVSIIDYNAASERNQTLLMVLTACACARRYYLHTIATTKSLHMNSTKSVTLSTTAKRMMLRRMRPNAVNADTQKFLP